jgi:hypothetical protein
VLWNRRAVVILAVDLRNRGEEVGSLSAQA